LRDATWTAKAMMPGPPAGNDSDLERLAAGNVLRALRGAEGVATRLATTRRPSAATIEALDRP
jgi:membrane dipeptidase